MPTFRLETHDGQHDTIEANRLDITDDQIVFIQRRDAGWRAVATAELSGVRTVDRVRVPVEVLMWTAHDEGRPITHLLLRDSTSRVVVEAENDRAAAVLRRQARFDALTGLANRYELEERLAQALQAPDGGRVALLVADLDGFKPINDRYGHAVGDEVLAAVARRLRSCVRDSDTVARLGGDEFVILTRVSTALEPTDLAARIRQTLRDPVQTSEGVLTVKASLGVAVAELGSDASDLLRHADRAMYRVKLARR